MGSWKINQIMCIGCVMGYVAMIIYGIDEQTVSPQHIGAWQWMCNLRLWIWILSYTLLFMPLFAKTYRLSRIFNEILEKKCIYDSDLLKGIALCLCVDLILLTLYTAIEPLQRMYIGLDFKQIDELQRVHFIYGSCETNNNSQYIFYACIALWKCIESLFGIYCALSVSRVGMMGHRALSQFDETSQQLLSIIFLIVALCIALPIGILGSAHPSNFYAVIGFLTISVGNVTTSLNMFPRIYALMQGTANAKFRQSPQEKMESLIMAQFKKYGLPTKQTAINTNRASYNRSDAVMSSSDHDQKEVDVSNVQLAIPTLEQTQSPLTPTTNEIVLPPPQIINDDVDVIQELDKKFSAGPDDMDSRQFEKKISATPVSQELATHLTTNNSQEQNIEEQP